MLASESNISADQWPIACKMSFPASTEAAASVWAGQLGQVADLGYRSIDPFDDWIDLPRLSDDRFAELCGLLRQFNLDVFAISIGRRSLVDETRGDSNLAYVKKTVDRAADVGARVVNLGFQQPLTTAQEQAMWFWHQPGHKDNEKQRDTAIRRVREVADYASDVDVEISLEIYEDTFLGTPKRAVEFLHGVDRENVGLNPDIGNLIRLHRPMPRYRDMYEAVLPYANYWHVKNYFRDEDPATGAFLSAPASLESGIINYREIIGRALDLGYKGGFTTEHYGGDWLGVGARNAKYIRDVVEQHLRLRQRSPIPLQSR